MRINYFCPHHMKLIQNNEQTAAQWWHELMKRGMLAFNDCRLEAADIYFKSALSLSLLRYSEPHNSWLNSSHISKPAEFLVELSLNEHKYEAAIQLLSEISNGIRDFGSQFEDTLMEFLALQYERIESMEKSCIKETAREKQLLSSSVLAANMTNPLPSLH